ncbi:hypothetical protein PV328_005233 [Microctonus aethiopoides]|uniref:Peptidase M12B domain-containing protein n=1 Tax=Microctonus aethiopoides TaxID=144406 RepID=A0AA39KS91_9HYME|nr:hypothetical protein PV328_005233 [Microctonus aethiopoides]
MNIKLDIRRLVTLTEDEKEILKGMIKHGGREIHMNWKKTKQLLVNEHLPVWIASTRVERSCRYSQSRAIHELQQNFVKENIGEFIFYHDIETMSAVVYFKNTKTLNGIVDIRYIIKEMPISECNQGHEVGGPYVKLRQKSLNVHDYLKPFNFPTHHNEEWNIVQHEFSANDEYQIPTKHQRLDDNINERQVTTLYPEILIFVPYSMIEYVKTGNVMNANAYILKYYIIHFHCVDMLLAKLSTDDIKIHLNLAGIVFEGKNNIFNFMKHIDVGAHGFDQIRYIDVRPTVDLIKNYINMNLDTFPEDSFDFYFVSAGFEMSTDGNVCQGVSLKLDYYQTRKNFPPLNRERLGLLVQYSGGCDFVIAAHELGHLMFIKHEPQTEGYQDGIKQCYAIMQETNPYCIDCLKWTEQNIEDLNKFVKENRNHCFLLNKPRSLQPHGRRIKMLSRLDQCRCYGFEHWPIKDLRDYIDEVSQNSCDQEMICGHKHCEVNTILPFDGTPCAANKVCWNEACQVISDLRGSPTPQAGPSNSNN